MSKNKTTIITEDPSLAAKILKEGGIVLFPTETVYGLGADSRNLSSCLEIYKIKNRPADNPLIVHLGNPALIPDIGEVPENARILIRQCMPGPLSLVLKKIDKSVFSTGLTTIAVRVPSHPKALEMLSYFGGPVSAPSANLSGEPSITRLDDAISEFDGLVDLILKGSDPEIGLESTVVDFSISPPKLLRPGYFGWEELQKYVPDLEDYSLLKEGDIVSSPGVKYKHYSPKAKVIFTENQTPDRESAAIGISLTRGWKFALDLRNNTEYMKNLYSFFRDCDRLGISKIYCFPPAKASGKEALLNRILKAQES
ncbi:threonylcarbamoyl-AMP synthase [Leptospira hartskeerlii]|uniref:Threonylcarbamoyl-AMP synthase n=1 Tax=Leptospira hartskeerlii TaxID=2023177 RepID=A0A2M9XER3_9LEPT|nr:L-threonylcarbamoyladenylate synthase [Leptospira hartskeerlii]PJZ26119.1 threonylcarbamoyl-AMP synthase [Leptospira hartskeerlii]PJZ34203.1 threonylcarbamoyl-AMP synthase [Leptospira hartskeerlii]